MRRYPLYWLSSALLLYTACTQRTEPAPANRDGISGGANTAKLETQPQPNGKGEPGAAIPFDGFQEEFELGPDQYTVLVGSFPTKEQAQELSYFLRMNRANNFVDHVGDEWRVCIGKYGSIKGAERTLTLMQKRGALDKLRRSGYGDPVIQGPGH